MNNKKGFFATLAKCTSPGFVLMSVLIGGGFATGREIVQYGGQYGARGWIVGLSIALVFSIICMVSFEIARKYKAYDYRSHLKVYAGPLSILYEDEELLVVDKPKGIRYLGFGFYFDTFAKGYKARPHSKAVAKFKVQMKKLTCRSWGVSNSYKVQKLNQLIRGWINYFKIGSMKGLCERLDSNIRYRLRMCIWKHWKTPQNRAKNLMKLDVPRWAAYKIAYCGNRYARLAHNGWVHKAISNERLAAFGLVSMSSYYAERRVICEVD